MDEGDEGGLGFFTRSVCRARFLRRLHAGEAGRAAFMLVDVDDFSRFNILHSHSFGDRFLRQTASDAIALLPEGCESCRYGADQMLVVGYGLGKADLRELYRSFVQYGRTERELDGVSYRFTVSAALMTFPDDAADWDSIERGLSVALKKAKRDGKARIVEYTDALLDDRLQEQMLVAQLSNDVAAGFRGFDVAHQPLCDSASLKVCGAEALLRYRSPDGTSVSPVELVPVLESSGLIKPVGLWILEQAIVDCRKWLALIPTFREDVNVSVVQLRDPAFCGQVKDLLERYGLDPHGIVLELTESLYMDDDVRVLENIKSLRAMGLGFAVDDFGTGYSSLSRLMTFDCELVKIDRAFVQLLGKSTANDEFVKSVVDLCHRSGKKVCAEGVEQIEELQSVNSIGADLVQGFYISRPVDKDAFERTFVTGDFDGDPLLFMPDAAFRRKQLAYNRDFLLSVVESMPISMHLMNSRNEVVMWNEATTRLFGCLPDADRIGVLDELSPAYQPDGESSETKARRLLDRAFGEGRTTFEWTHLDVDGNPLPVEVTIVKLEVIDEFGEPMLACFLRDLRPRRVAEERDRQFNGKLKAIIDATPLCLNLWNHRLELVMCNKEAVELFGLRDERQYLDDFNLLSPEFQPDGKSSVVKAREKLEEAFRTGGCRFPWLHRRLDGESVPAEVTLAKLDIQDEEGFDMVAGFTRDLRVFDGPRRTNGEGAGAMLRNLADVSDGKRLIDELRIDAVFWDIVSDLSDELLFRLMVRSSTIEYLGRMRDMFNIDHYMEDFPDSIVERGNIFADDVPAFLELARNMKAGIVKPMDMRFVMTDGRHHWFRIVYDCMYDEEGLPIMTAGKAMDIQAEKELEQKARIDLLTQCYNKVSFEDEVRAALSAETRGAFLIVDIDDFKSVNDTLGHHFGDLVLVEVAHCLRSCFAASDIVGRIGGDEFVVFARGAADHAAIEARARAAIEAVNGLYSDGGGGRRVSVSVGVARFPRDGSSYDELYRASDEALYRSKSRGKNCCTFYDPGIGPGVLQGRTIADDSAYGTSDYYDAELVSTVFNLLYETSDLAISSKAVIKYLGQRLRVENCYVFEAVEGGEAYRCACSWRAGGSDGVARASADVPRGQWDGLFGSANSEGVVVCRDAAEIERCGACGIVRDPRTQSLLHALVRTDGDATTIVGFENHASGRVWSEREVNSIVYASKILSVFLRNERKNRVLRESCSTLDSMLEGSDAFTYVVDRETFDILYANKRLRELAPDAHAGEKCYRAIRHVERACEDCPMLLLGEHDGLPPIELRDADMLLVSSVKRIAWKGETDAVMVTSMDVTGKKSYPI